MSVGWVGEMRRVMLNDRIHQQRDAMDNAME